MKHTSPLRHASHSMRRPLALAVALALSAPFSASFAAIAVQPPGASPGGQGITVPRMTHPMGLGSVPYASAVVTPPALTTLPDFYKVTAGSASVHSVVSTAPVMTIDQSTKGAIIEWNSFDIGASSTVNFTNANYGSNSVTLNRVIVARPNHVPTQIFGQLTAVGSIFLIDPSGITFGQGSSVNVGGLVASVLDTDETDFKSHFDDGQFTFSLASAEGNAVTNEGTIKAKTGGTVALIGYEQGHGYDEGGAFNAGSIVADGGSIGLLNGKTVTVDFNGDGLTQFEIKEASPIHQQGRYNVGNTGLLRADGGQVLLSSRSIASTAGTNLGALVVNGDGIIRARSMTSRNGSIVLDAGAGDVAVNGGRLDATGGASLSGGNISVSGKHVLLDGSYDLCTFVLACTAAFSSGPLDINASGSTGGTIAINATLLINLETDAALSASGLRLRANGTSGSGGSVLLHSSTTVASSAAAPMGILAEGGMSLSARSTDAEGGSIDVQGARGMAVFASALARNRLSDAPVFDVSGVNGGKVTVNAGGTTLLDSQAAIGAYGRTGVGGKVRLYGGNGLIAWNSIRADGGDRGGLVDTSSGSGMDLRGIRVNATGGSRGAAGIWSIDPSDVTIAHGSGTGVLGGTGMFFGNVAATTLNDADISNALNNNTSVTITTGDPSVGTDEGNISFDSGVAIKRTVGTAPVTFQLDAHAQINGGNFSIVADPGTGPITMLFDSDADQLLDYAGGGIKLSSVILRSNGGDIRMYGQKNATTGFSGEIYLGGDDTLIDTRISGSNTAAAGNLLLRGHGDDISRSGGIGVLLGRDSITQAGMVISTGSGNIDIIGMGANGGDGISLATNDDGPLQLVTSSGHIALSGFGSISTTQFSIGGAGQGISTDIGGIGGISLRTDSGTIDLRGYALADSDDGNGTLLSHNGLTLGAGTQILSNSGNVLLTGSSLGSGIGLVVTGGIGSNNVGTLVDAGSGNIVFRSHNDPSSHVRSLQMGDGVAARTRRTIDIRGGGINSMGNVVENANDNISIGAGSSFDSGIDISVKNLAQLNSETLVLGSDIQTGNVTVSTAAGDISYTGNLSLYAGGGGSVQLNGGSVNVGANTLALVASQDVSQTGAIFAGSLLAIANLGTVRLTNAGNNVAAHTVGGNAGGAFTFYNSGDVGIGTVNATGFNATSNSSNALSASGITAGGAVLAQSMAGNILLNGNVSGRSVDLVTGPKAFFLNPLGAAINAGDFWHVWASGWSGETRGGLAGSGDLPNLYGCSFGSGCGSTVVVPNTGSHFLYAMQPTATITVADSSREYGVANGPLDYGITGMILGDNAAQAISGSATTTATQGSDAGTYAIDGNFSSPAGYLLNIIPGSLTVGSLILTYTANPSSRLYGEANPSFDGTVTGFRLTDTLANSTQGTLIFSSSATEASGVGTYAIYGSGLSSTNYIFVQASSNAEALSITPATLTYISNNYSRNYGDFNPIFSGTVSGFRVADTQANATSGNLVFSTLATQASDVGKYAINGGGLSATNYVFVQAIGNATALDVTPATLTYVANSYSRVYGDQNPDLDGTIEGFRLSDTQASATSGKLVFSTSATQASNVGNYAIDGSGLTAKNYSFTQAAGNTNALSITPAVLTYVANPYRRVYGDPNAALNGSIEGFRLTDTQTNATSGNLVFSTNAMQASNVGNYAIDGSGLFATNYSFIQAAGNANALSITPATLTYVANLYSRIYGDPNAALDGTIEGFRLTDTQANATSGNLVFSTNAVQSSNVGQYAIYGSGLRATNYVLVQAQVNNNALGITPATLSYIANPYSRVYGDTNPVLDGTVSGFRLADTQSNATSGQLKFATNATTGSDVGTYAINGSGLSANNYVFSQAPANATAFAITPATLTYVANLRQRPVGVADGSFDGSVSGFRNGDTLSAATTGTLMFGSLANTNSPTGIYAINGSGLSASNYTFIQASGNAVALTITPPRGTYTLDFVRETPVTYVYDRNFGMVGLCPATDLAAGSRDKDGDTLAREWSRVRSRPNLANCVSTRQENSCGDF